MTTQSTKSLLLAAALLAGGCTSGASTTGGADDGGAWMDGATVVVARSDSTGRQTVTLIDPESGFSQVMSDEPLTPGAVEQEDPDLMAVALAAGITN